VEIRLDSNIIIYGMLLSYKESLNGVLIQGTLSFNETYVLECNTRLSTHKSGFGELVVSMLASVTQVSGFKPGQNRRIFRAKKSSVCLPSKGK
jgi:hypothetical protein